MLPELLQVWSRVVLGVFNAKGGVASLVADIRLKVGAFRAFIKVKEGVALVVRFIDEGAGNPVICKGKEPDVLEGVADFIDKLLAFLRVIRGGQTKVNGGDTPRHSDQSL